MSPMPPAAEALDLFLHEASVRIERLAASSLADAVPQEYRAAARSIARQAAGGWKVVRTSEPGFALRSAMRELRMTEQFGEQCRRVLELTAATRNPDLLAALSLLGDAGQQSAAVMSAFFHYFAAHEFLHVEQRLGSDQYKDSDAYMPIVMEADHVADVAGLAVVSMAPVPELAALDLRQRVLLFVAVHVSAMHSFDARDGSGLDAYAFSRLLIWYLHFARLTKAPSAPDLASVTFSRPWIVTLPRLIGRRDQKVTLAGLDRRRRRPLAANSDVVLAYYHEDGLYRIHRAVLTDGDRVLRLAKAVVEARFDDVRVEMEEILVNNPALVPTERRSSEVEWAAGSVIEEVERFGAPSTLGREMPIEEVTAVRAAYDRLAAAARAVAGAAPDVARLLVEGDGLVGAMASTPTDVGAAARRRRLLVSVVDQIALLLA